MGGGGEEGREWVEGKGSQHFHSTYHSTSIPTFSAASLSALAFASSFSSCCLSPFSFFTVLSFSLRSASRDSIWELASAEWERNSTLPWGLVQKHSSPSFHPHHSSPPLFPWLPFPFTPTPHSPLTFTHHHASV